MVLATSAASSASARGEALWFLGTKIVHLVNMRVMKVRYQTSSYRERILSTYRGSAMPETETYQIEIWKLIPCALTDVQI